MVGVVRGKLEPVETFPHLGRRKELGEGLDVAGREVALATVYLALPPLPGLALDRHHIACASTPVSWWGPTEEKREEKRHLVAGTVRSVARDESRTERDTVRPRRHHCQSLAQQRQQSAKLALARPRLAALLPRVRRAASESRQVSDWSE